MDYSELREDEFRLLSLGSKDDEARATQPDETSSPDLPENLECRVVEYAYGSSDGFEALSYVWGDATDTVSIKVNGQPCTITKNLYVALRYLQHQSESRTLWVDALCIHQENTEERNHQVAQMRRIFSEASKVVIWLGEPWPGHENMFDMAEQYSKTRGLHADPDVENHFTVNGLDLKSLELRRDFVNFFDRAWWSRLWTVQEFKQGKSVQFQCGNRIISEAEINDLAAGLVWHSHRCCIGVRTGFAEYVTDKVSLYRAVNRLVDLYIARGTIESSDFLYMVASFRGRQSSDPKDKIYGLLGLLDSDFAATIEPDYTHSVETVYEDFVYACIKHGGDLRIFGHLLGRQNPDLPSFVPDWTYQLQQEMSTTSYLLRIESANVYSACGSLACKTERLAPGQMSCSGVVFDTISLVNDGSHYLPNELSLLNWIDIMQGAQSPETPYPGLRPPTTFANVISRILCGDLSSEDGRPVSIKDWPDEKVASDVKDWKEVHMAATWRSTVTTTSVAAFQEASLAAASNRKLVQTTNGYLGLAPEICRVGDVIAVLAGGKVPYVLRPVSDGEDDGPDGERLSARYFMLGDSYIHGIMYGEAVMDADGNDVELKEIILQ